MRAIRSPEVALGLHLNRTGSMRLEVRGSTCRSKIEARGKPATMRCAGLQFIPLCSTALDETGTNPWPQKHEPPRARFSLVNDERCSDGSFGPSSGQLVNTRR